MSNQYETYLNIQKFIEKRGYKVLGKYENKDDFGSLMDFHSKVEIHCISKTGQNIHIFLTHANMTKLRKNTIKTDYLKKIVFSVIKKDKKAPKIIIISPEPISQLSRFNMTHAKGIEIINMLQIHFTTDITKGPFCFPHTIVPKDQVGPIMHSLGINKLYNLPKIKKTDPQCLRIGANVGDLIKIESLSQMAGKRISYRFCIP